MHASSIVAHKPAHNEYVFKSTLQRSTRDEQVYLAVALLARLNPTATIQ